MGRHKDTSKIPIKYVEKQILNDNDKLDKPELAQEIIEGVIGQKKASRSVKYHLYRLFGLDTEGASRLAGLAIKSGYDLNHRLKNNDHEYQKLQTFLGGFPDRYRDLCRARLLQLSEIEGKALEEYRKDPRLLIDKPQLAKQVKQGAGVLLGEDIRQVIPLINIEEMRVLIQTKLGLNEGSNEEDESDND